MASGYEKAAIGVDEHWNEINPSPIRDALLYLFIFIVGGATLYGKAIWIWEGLKWITSQNAGM